MTKVGRWSLEEGLDESQCPNQNMFVVKRSIERKEPLALKSKEKKSKKNTKQQVLPIDLLEQGTLSPVTLEEFLYED